MNSTFAAVSLFLLRHFDWDQIRDSVINCLFHCDCESCPVKSTTTTWQSDCGGLKSACDNLVSFFHFFFFFSLIYTDIWPWHFSAGKGVSQCSVSTDWQSHPCHLLSILVLSLETHCHLSPCCDFYFGYKLIMPIVSYLYFHVFFSSFLPWSELYFKWLKVMMQLSPVQQNSTHFFLTIFSWEGNLLAEKLLLAD